jgi:mycothiol synthase
MPIRWYDELVRPISEPLIRRAETVEIRHWEEAPSDDTLEASNASFADHWGSTPRDAEAWKHLMSSSTIRTDLSFVAVAGSRVVGICLNAHYPDDGGVTGRLDGWIAQLGVLSEWRRQGVTSALIARSLDAFRETGFTHAMIGVDADNPTGASGLYRRLSFVPLARSVTNELTIQPR